MSATVISMSILGETIGTCILPYFILHETISLQQGLGITVIFIGLVLFYCSQVLIKSMTYAVMLLTIHYVQLNHSV